MNVSIDKIFLSVILCMVFCGLGLLVWASGYYLVDLTGWRLEVFDLIAVALFFAGFMSCCVVNDINDETGRNS